MVKEHKVKKHKVRERKRPDWPILVYKYRAYPIGEVPETLWENVKQQHNLWNNLVEIGDRYREKWESIKSDDSIPKSEHRKYWSDFREECREEGKVSSLNWELAPWVVDKFLTAHQRGFQYGEGFPHKQYAIPRVNIVHRYTAGGMSVDHLPNVKKATKFMLDHYPPAIVYQDNSRRSRRKRIVRGIFGVDGEQIKFSVVLHRPLPEKGYIKQVAWLGKYQWNPDVKKRWTWHIALWVEIPPFIVDNDQHDNQNVMGLDMGWRRFDEYIRIGYLLDTDGREMELRLPLDLSNYRTRRDGLPASWQGAWDLQREMDKTVEDTKAEVKKLLKDAKLSKEVRRSVAVISRMKAGGLRRLLQKLIDESDNESGGNKETGAIDEVEANDNIEKAKTLLEEWKQEYNLVRRDYRVLTERLTRRRKWLYGNLAKWLMNTYNVVVWNENLNIKNIAENAESRALRKAAKYRQIAAIGELRSMLRHAAAKYGAQVVGYDGDNPTGSCSTCGGTVERGPDLMLTCENGHFLDQDKNAATNLLLSQIDGGIAQTSDLRKSVSIPPQLSDIVVMR